MSHLNLLSLKTLRLGSHKRKIGKCVEKKCRRGKTGKNGKFRENDKDEMRHS
jgi:hypothetical protein